MNATAAKLAAKRRDEAELHEIVKDFVAAEVPIIEAAKTEFGLFMRDALPRMQGYALESGTWTGKMTVEIEVDLTPGKKAIKLTGLSTPPPWTIERKAAIKY